MRLLSRVLLAGVLVTAFAGPALAAGHGAAPSGTLFDALVYEVTHFFMHLQLTFDAVATMIIVGPANGWALLQVASDPTCIGLSALTPLFFGSPAAALLTFAATILLTLYLARLVLRRLFGRYRSFGKMAIA